MDSVLLPNHLSPRQCSHRVREAQDLSPPVQATIKSPEISDLHSHTLSLISSPKSFDFEAEFLSFLFMKTGMYAGVEELHFLEACSLCRRPLGFNRDIFMYKGNTAFCSKDCRQEQIEIDEAQEKSWRISSSGKTTASRKKNVRTDTVAVA